MDEPTLSLLQQLEGASGRDFATALQVTQRLGLPRDYVDLLVEHDGARGFIGENYVDFYGTSELTEEAGFPELDHLANVVVFGSNGAGEAFAFDATGHVVMVPWIGGTEDAIRQGTFEEFLRRLRDDRLFDRG